MRTAATAEIAAPETVASVRSLRRRRVSGEEGERRREAAGRRRGAAARHALGDLAVEVHALELGEEAAHRGRSAARRPEVCAKGSIHRRGFGFVSAPSHARRLVPRRPRCAAPRYSSGGARWASSQAASAHARKEEGFAKPCSWRAAVASAHSNEILAKWVGARSRSVARWRPRRRPPRGGRTWTRPGLPRGPSPSPTSRVSLVPPE
jgi:hypothetical protein